MVKETHIYSTYYVVNALGLVVEILLWQISSFLEFGVVRILPSVIEERLREETCPKWPAISGSYTSDLVQKEEVDLKLAA